MATKEQMFLNIVRYDGSEKSIPIDSEFLVGRKAVIESWMCRYFYISYEIVEEINGKWETIETVEEEDPIYIGQLMTGEEILEEEEILRFVGNIEKSELYIVSDYVRNNRLDIKIYQGETVVNRGGTVIKEAEIKKAS